MSMAAVSSVLCCLCGLTMEPNPSNMCVSCLRQQVDITDGISKELMLQFCRGCGRYLVPPNGWVYAELESKELLALCLKRIKGMKTVKLVDAGFVWTEPHSKRLKVRITIQKEVMDSTILQQSLVVTYIVHQQQCESCSRLESDQTWRAACQVRQKVEHKRTFLYLEQLILKHNMHSHTVTIKDQPDGIDFFFNHRTHALQFTAFLHSVAPATSLTAKQLISQDDHSNTYNFKYTFSVELAPVCRDDMVVIPPKMHSQMGGIGPVVLVYKVSNAIHLIDPQTLQTAEIEPKIYFKNPFRATLGAKNLTEFVVLDVEPVSFTNKQLQSSYASSRFKLVEATLARSSDLGVNDNVSFVRTHLGHLLHPGDTVMGYDLTTAVANDSAFMDYMSSAASSNAVQASNAASGSANAKNRISSRFPDIVLIRKVYPNNAKRSKKRKWHLRRLAVEGTADGTIGAAGDGGLSKKSAAQYDMAVQRAADDYEHFLQDLEEDPELRAQVRLFKNSQAIRQKDADGMSVASTFDEDLPQVPADELVEEAAYRVVHTGEALKTDDDLESHADDDLDSTVESMDDGDSTAE
eukprot:ANDGO_02061.mRNA.1 60S ribosomal export protein NMD3